MEIPTTCRRFTSEDLERQRQRIGISKAMLARKTGVPLPTVNRILSGHAQCASYGNVMAIAEVLGAEVSFTPAAKLRERQARAKARRLVGLVQGTSALELQAVPSDAEDQMVEQTVHELLASPSGRRLWDDL